LGSLQFIYITVKGKIGKGKFNLEQAMKAQRESEGIDYSFFNLGYRRR